MKPVCLTHDAPLADAQAWQEAAPFVPSLAQRVAALEPIIAHMLTLDDAALREYVAGTRAGTVAAMAIHEFKQRKAVTQ